MALLLSLIAALLLPASASAGDGERGHHGDGHRGARSVIAGVHLVLDYEVGPLAILQNDGRYGPEGTDYDANDVGQRENLLVGQRASLTLGLGQRHSVILLYAPLFASTRVTLDQDLQFNDQLFAEDTVVDHDYLFDGYRISYLYGLLRGSLDLDVGASLQVRNAAVKFTTADGQLFAQETDIGLVPALKLRLRYSPFDGSPYAELEADGLSAFGLTEGEGALYDVALGLGLPIADSADLVLRARLLGGGAEVVSRDIYNWGNFASLSAGLRVRLDRLL